jgi:hypothetical protein
VLRPVPGKATHDRDIHRLADLLRLHDPCFNDFCAFSIVIMTVELLIEDSPVAFAKPCR